MEDKRIYLVRVEQGEYSDYTQSIIGVFDNLKMAQELRDKKKKEYNEYYEKCGLAMLLINGDITEEEAGMTLKETWKYSYYGGYEPRYSVLSLSLNQEDIERNEG